MMQHESSVKRKKEKGKKNTKSYPMRTRVYTLTGNSFRMQWSARAHVSRDLTCERIEGTCCQRARSKQNSAITFKRDKLYFYRNRLSFILCVKLESISAIFQNGGSSWNLKNKKKSVRVATCFLWESIYNIAPIVNSWAQPYSFAS